MRRNAMIKRNAMTKRIATTKRVALALFAMTLAALLAGCLPKSKDWVHPRIADPRKEDAQFLDDTAFCEGKIGQAQGAGQDSSREASMNDCYRRLGWQQKE